MKTIALASLLLLAPALLGAQEVSLPLGTQAPPAALEDLDGNPVQILDFVEEGRVTLLEFWALWCDNCEALQPQMSEIARRWEDQVNVVAVAVAVNQNPRRVRRHVEDHAPGHPYLWDARGEAVRAYGAATTSIVVILDKAGKVAYTGVGRNQDLVGKIRELVEG